MHSPTHSYFVSSVPAAQRLHAEFKFHSQFCLLYCKRRKEEGGGGAVAAADIDVAIIIMRAPVL